MKILHRYLLTTLLRNLGLSLVAFTLLFLIFDFFDRMDNILPENASVAIVLQYFLYKIPLIVSLMLPVSVIVATLFTVGMLSKNSEITAMRASGLTVTWISRPLYITGLALSLGAILLNETIVPYATRRGKEIYNLDIQKKHEQGAYNQNDFWWRSGNSFFSVSMFDSRTDTLYDLTRLDISDTFEIQKRIEAKKVDFLTANLGWTMRNVREFRFTKDGITEYKIPTAIPLTISAVPQDFYEVRTDPHTMSYRQLKKFIRTQAQNGVSTQEYLPDLYEKLASPFLIFIVIPVVLPFALKPARSGSLALSFVGALAIGFSYYAVHSLSLSLGRADLWPALLSAWMANIVMGIIGLVLTLGSEAP